MVTSNSLKISEIDENMFVEQEDQKEHKFWTKQPVQQHGKEVYQIQQVDREQVPKKLPDLPSQFILQPMVLKQDIDEIQQFLKDNYVGDRAGTTRFNYSKQFLQWWFSISELTILVGLRLTQDLNGHHQNELIGFISGIGLDTVIKGKEMKSLAVDFLTVQHDFRNDNLATYLIADLTNRSYRQRCYTAVFTAAFTARQKNPIIPRAQVNTYWHKILNPQKCLEAQFCSKPKSMSLREYQLENRVKPINKTIFDRFQQTTKSHAQKLAEFLNKYNSEHYSTYFIFNDKIVQKMFKNTENVIVSKVAYDKEGNVEAFYSYYIIDTQLLDPEIRKLHQNLKIGYSFYYGTNSDQITLDNVFTSMITDMKNNGCDIATCLDVQQNEVMIKGQDMHVGTGAIGFHFFNINFGDELKNNENGIVLV